ncbi:MAG: hypothetical protein U5N21_17520 [Rhodococcus sp. (in: high G+C Gram-positive bacteria)]|nr:hypothetical protein [Rhodococcus sp. (in: high G+C Gram-positive bacteria)]
MSDADPYTQWMVETARRLGAGVHYATEYEQPHVVEIRDGGTRTTIPTSPGGYDRHLE